MFTGLLKNLKENRRTIVFTEGPDARILEAAARLLKEDLMDVILVGNVEEVKAAAERLRQQYSVFQAASEVARNTLECNLRAIEQLQAQRMGDDAQAKELRNTRQTDFRA